MEGLGCEVARGAVVLAFCALPLLVLTVGNQYNYAQGCDHACFACLVVTLVTQPKCAYSYERTYPVYKRQPIKTYHQPNATVYVVNGAAGDIEGTQNDWKRDIDWRAFHNEERYTGYSRMEANKQALSWTYYDAKHGQVVDTWTLTK
eukprot:TRINITY_DN7022_c0_g1_i3.p1 TRINITY_DN7022_c0_g1~~TRINITY_DN7022_c0_g1_i3.p1  ORF type:complete len:147 (+),score=31.38 TRINITY_DN7022_c0_g1_i3:392-832(+)